MTVTISTNPPLPPRILLIAGLHGAGKSTLIKNLERETDFLVFDDFMKNSVDDQRDFLSCFHRDSIIEALKLKKNIILAETRLCEPDFREEFLSDLARLVDPYEISWHCFAPDLAACSDNILARSLSLNQSYITQEETHNQKLALVYTYPSGAFIHPVTRAQPKKLKSLKLRFFLTALLALLALLVAIPPYLSELAATMNSDQLILPDIYESLVLRGDSWSSWAIGGALFLVPDVALMLPLAHLVKDSYLAYLLMTGIFMSVFLFSLVALSRTRMGLSSCRDLPLMLIFFLVITHPGLWPQAVSFWGVLFHPFVHGGVYLLVLGSMLCVAHHLRSRSGVLSLGLLMMLVASGTVSDLLYVVYFTVPCLVSLIFLAIYQKQPGARLWRPATAIILGSVIGRLIRPWLSPGVQAESSYLSQLGPMTGFHTALRMIQDLIIPRNWMFAGFALLSLIAAIILFVPILRRILLNKTISWRLGYLDLSVVLCVACGWTALLFTGNYIDFGSWRYVVFPSALSILWLLLLLCRHLPRKPNTLTWIIFLCLCLGPGFSKPDLKRPYPELARYIDHHYKNQPVIILGDYWTARKTTFLSRHGLRVEPICSNGDLYHWANSWMTYLPIRSDRDLPVVVVMDRLNILEIEGAYGEPDLKEQIGEHLIYFYSAPKSLKARSQIQNNVAKLAAAESKTKP